MCSLRPNRNCHLPFLHLLQCCNSAPFLVLPSYRSLLLVLLMRGRQCRPLLTPQATSMRIAPMTHILLSRYRKSGTNGWQRVCWGDKEATSILIPKANPQLIYGTAFTGSSMLARTHNIWSRPSRRGDNQKRLSESRLGSQQPRRNCQSSPDTTRTDLKPLTRLSLTLRDEVGCPNQTRSSASTRTT